MRSCGCKAFLYTSTASVMLFALQACTTVGPDYTEPQVKTPDTWSMQITEQVMQGSQASLQSWWTIFNDPVLDRLIEDCRRDNIDIQISLSRIREARTMLAMATGEKQPFLNANASAARNKLSDDGTFQQVAPADGFSAQNILQLGFDASWELDVFGRVRRSIEAAEAGYEASIEDYRDVMVTLFAEVAMTYIEIRSAQQQILIAQDNADAQRQSLALAEERFTTGISSKLDVAQAKANLAMTQSGIPTLEISLNQAVNRLAVLLGKNAGGLQAAFSNNLPLPKPTMPIGVGVPRDVLRQRPDIRGAERKLAAQIAEVGVATADLYPRFGLGGFFGVQSRSLGNLLDSSSLTWGVAAPVQWSIFNGGLLRGNLQIQDEKAQQLLLVYRNKVLTAFREVEDAILAYDLNRQRLTTLQQATTASRDAVDMVLAQYNTGLTDFNNVLVTQRDLYMQQSQQLAAETETVLNIVSLYKALGGGWDIQAATVSGDDAVAGETPRSQ